MHNKLEAIATQSSSHARPDHLAVVSLSYFCQFLIKQPVLLSRLSCFYVEAAPP